MLPASNRQPAVTVTTQEFPGRRDMVAKAVEFVAGLVQHLPCATEAVLAASELATYAVEWTASGSSGGTFTVEVVVLPEAVTITVIDQGSPLLPRPRRPHDAKDGLPLVEYLADHFARYDNKAVAAFDFGVWS